MPEQISLIAFDNGLGIALVRQRRANKSSG
jgi:hypothetical protein